MPLRFEPLTPDRWDDLETLFGERGACGGCWCTAWRRTRAEFAKNKGANNKRFFLKVVQEGPPPGIIGYLKDQPIAWCAVAPRSEYPVLERSRVLKPVDEEPVWSVSCFFVHKDHRRKGISVKLLRAVIAFVKSQGGKIVEGYPTEPYTDNMPAPFAWVGLPASFLSAGFKEVARRSKGRPIMRKVIGKR